MATGFSKDRESQWFVLPPEYKHAKSTKLLGMAVQRLVCLILMNDKMNIGPSASGIRLYTVSLLVKRKRNVKATSEL